MAADVPHIRPPLYSRQQHHTCVQKNLVSLKCSTMATRIILLKHIVTSCQQLSISLRVKAKILAMTQKALPSLAAHDVSDLISCYITPWCHSRHTVLFTVLQIVYTKQVQDLYICYSSCLKAPPLDSHVVHALTFLPKRTSLTHYFKWLHIFSQSLSLTLSPAPHLSISFSCFVFSTTLTTITH